MKTFTKVLAVVLTAGFASTLQASAQSGREAPTNAATDHHGLPGNNPGFGGSSANPNGKGKNGGGGIHGIGNVPGQNADNHPSVGEPGFADQLGTVHGGLGGGHTGHGRGHRDR